MKVIKRTSSDIPKEEAHDGSGYRKVFASPEHLSGQHLEAMTHGLLPAGKTFDWHPQKSIEEVMVVLKGTGEVHDEDGVYAYSAGDVYIFPPNVEHKIHNPTNEEHEMVFVRVVV